jgi:hypothetical protein
VTALCRYRGVEPSITRELLDAACASYFVDGLRSEAPETTRRNRIRNRARSEVH